MDDGDFLRKCSEVFSLLAETGRFLRAKGHHEQSIRCFETLSRGDPSFEAGDHAYEIGLNYECMGDREKARMYFKIAVDENPAVADYRDAARRLGIEIPPDPAGVLD